ncbi:hypothetical protein BGZ96_003145 [Linnemannia gamsii]|uniref:DUF38 domain-containing protein n=1 Tax=Linnemannia gamsii TaxID=64522 RepID=A0ABQ7JKC5_9FUNG|nr:hypothetical protein BGZ96_003145 [Linnemannia gamsii]
MEVFKLIFEKEYVYDDVAEWRLTDAAGNVDWMTVIKKEEPLVNLEELSLWDIGEEASTDDIIAIFAHCPNSKKLSIEIFSEDYDHDAIGEFIGKECSKIQTLNCGSIEIGVDVDGPLLLLILEALPAQQLEVMIFRGSLSPFCASSFTRPIQRHSTALHTIHISHTATLEKISVAIIFEECISLQDFSLEFDRDHGRGLFATLSDILERPWNTSNLVSLSLGIGGCELPVEYEGQQPYYDRSAPITLSKAETVHFTRLEELYRRIGSLVELEFLGLEMMTLDTEGRVDMALMNKRKSFPAMLTLGDPKTGRPGYLSLLTDLKKLRYLRRLVHADSTESTATVGLEE